MKMRCGCMVAACVLAVTCWADDGAWDVSLADFARLPGETNDTERLQRAIDATGAERVLYVPRGVYAVSRPLIVTNASSILLHKSATLRAVAKMDAIMKIDMSAGSMWHWGKVREGASFDQGLFFKGGHLDGNGLASCLYLNKYFHLTLRDVVFLNGYPYGLHVGPKGAEIIANNLYFRVIKRGLAGNVALFSEGNDSYYSDLVAVDYTVGLRVDGAANLFTRFHVWGGPIPPVAPGRLPEMLENSVNFDLGGYMNTLRDCYADTGEVGFYVRGGRHLISGAWYYNNPGFHLKKVTVVKQSPHSSDLRIEGSCFRATGPETTLYEGPGRVQWRDMTYDHFAAGMELPGEAICERDDPRATSRDAWELIGTPAEGRYVSPAGEFAKPQSARALVIGVPRRAMAKRFPTAGAGKAIVMRVRATDDQTKRLEFSVAQAGGKVWGADVALTRDWREVRLPLASLRYFSHYKNMPKLALGEQPDARQFTNMRFMYGRWISDGTFDKPHGFEIGSLRIVEQEH